MFALLQVGAVLDRAAGRKGFARYLIERINDGSGGRRITGTCACFWLLFICAVETSRISARRKANCKRGLFVGQHEPSIVPPSFQLPDLLCFGVGFLSFITPFETRCEPPEACFFDEATLMVVSSSSTMLRAFSFHPSSNCGGSPACQTFARVRHLGGS